MPTFEHSFTVAAPLEAVQAFHASTEALKRLTPPPIFVDLHEVEPLGEGSNSHFTMWFGPVPVRWHARHVDVDESGFTDIQIAGPLQSWRHTHTYTALDDRRTRIEDRIEYSYPNGVRGLPARLAFNGPGLALLFAYRGWMTRRALGAGTHRLPLLLAALPLALLLLWRWAKGERDAP